MAHWLEAGSHRGDHGCVCVCLCFIRVGVCVCCSKKVVRFDSLTQHEISVCVVRKWFKNDHHS